MNIFVSALPDLKAIFGPSFFNLKAIVSYNIGQAAILSAILKIPQSHTAGADLI